MSRMESEQLVRDCARAAMDLRTTVGQEILECIRRPLLALAACPNIRELGVKREANHNDNSRYLYYDGQLSIVLDGFRSGKKIPPHDHGTWEAIALYSGRMQHSVYERQDDRSVEGFADLRIIDDRVLKPGDLAIVAPPSDIHTLSMLEDDTYSITVIGGHYKAERAYFNIEKKSYVLRTPKTMRIAQASA